MRIFLLIQETETVTEDSTRCNHGTACRCYCEREERRWTARVRRKIREVSFWEIFISEQAACQWPVNGKSLQDFDTELAYGRKNI